MSNNDQGPTLLSMKEAKGYFGEIGAPSRGTLYLWAREGRLPTVKIGRRVFVNRRALVSMLENAQPVSN